MQPDINNFYEVDNEKYFIKLIINLIFFLLINTVALNIIFGIIIDTFDDLRDQTTTEGIFNLYEIQKMTKIMFVIYVESKGI